MANRVTIESFRISESHSRRGLRECQLETLAGREVRRIHLRELPESITTALRDPGKSAAQIPADAALVPEPQRPRIVDDAESRNGRHQEHAADDEEDACRAGLRHLQDDQ